MKKWNYSSICAYTSLAISIIMMALWGCNVGGFTVVSLDSFVGVIVALLAIVVTLAIAWQIYNAVELKQKVEELNALQGQLEELKISSEQENHVSSANINYLFGISACEAGQFINAFRFLMIAFEHCIQMEDPKNVDLFLDGLEYNVKKIEVGVEYKSNLYNEVMQTNDAIQSSPYYVFIKSRYEKLFSEFLSKVKRHEE